MGRVLPILFNTDMVRAILDGRKTATRRVVKYKYNNTEMKMFTNKYGTRLIEIQKDVEGETYGKHPDGSTWRRIRPSIEKKAPYKPGDILYVRETWCNANKAGFEPDYYYFADTYICEDYIESEWKWRPSIHMPKEAARIWLKVTDVRVERLRSMRLDDFLDEGVVIRPKAYNDPENAYWQAMQQFIDIWHHTFKRNEDIRKYGWPCNPWVWVIEFERCEKPESEER